MKTVSNKSDSFQHAAAVVLAAIVGSLVGFQMSFLVINMLLFMELIQMETTFYILLYVPVTVGLTALWVIIHHFFMVRFKPEEYGVDDSKVTSVELSRVRSLQVILGCMSMFIMVAALIFESRFPGNIAPGDGHIVQNGMDTRSAIYTVWLIILMIVFIGGAHFVTNAVYLFDLYLNQFRKTLKQSAK